VLDPTKDDVKQKVLENTEGVGVDVLLEMAGRQDAIKLGFSILRLGGRASLLGIPGKPIEINLAEDIIFKGAIVQGINGRKMYETWYQMESLLKANLLDLRPVITDRIPMNDFSKAMERLQSGEASKILMYPNGAK
jgi:threonine 3-dehydrogenase